MAFKIRRGTDAERQAYTPAIGEPIWATDTKRLWIGDGITVGGIAADAESYLTNEYLQDLTAAMFTAGGHSGVTFTYDDNTGRIIATVNFPPAAPASSGSFHFNLTGVDSSLTQINSSETIQFLGSNGINVNVNDTGGTTIVNIDGLNVPGGGGSANLEDVGWFVTGSDSTQTRINNDETLQFLGANGITIAVDDTAAPARLTITGPVGSTSNEVFSIPYYTTTNSSTLVSSGPDLRFSSEHSTLSTNVLGANTVISQLISTPLTVTNIQANTPIVGRATVTFNTHPHPPFYNGRNIKLYDLGGGVSSWNGVYETAPSPESASTVTTVVIQTTNSDPYPGGTGKVRETTTRGIGLFPTGEDRYVNLGGTLDLNNTLGPVEYGARLRVVDDSGLGFGNNYSIAEFVQIHNDVFTNGFQLIRGRGTFNTTTSVQNGDMLGSILFTGLDGVNSAFLNGYVPPASASIYASAAETPAAIPQSPGIAGRMVFQTARPGSGYNLFDAMVIDQYQAVQVPSKLVISDTVQISGNQIQTINSNANLDIRTNGTGIINLLEDTSVSGILTVSGTLNVSTLDTTDSSAINFTPAVTFNSDVTVQNDLTVTNKVYANEFVSTSTGDPELYSNTDLDITVGVKTYTLAANGGLQMPILSSAPVSPVIGAIYVADNSGWDPVSKAGTDPYPVFWNGSSYNALY
jgi:hypothetical protein